MGVLLAVCGGKDGVGKTTFAMHLAYSLYRHSKKNVCLVEADVGNFGDLSVVFNAKNIKNFVDFTRQASKFDPKLTQNWIGKHPSGLFLMGAAQFVTDFQQVEDTSASKAFQLLSRSFDFTVLDVGREINPVSFRALESSELIYIITDSDILSVNQTGNFIKRLRSLHFGNDQFQLVMNRFDPRGVITPQVLRQKFQLDAKIQLPSDPAAFQQVISNAKPLQILNPKHPYLKGIDEGVRSAMSAAERASKTRKPSVPSQQSLDVLKQVLPFTYGSDSSAKEVPKKGTTPDSVLQRNLSIRARVHERLVDLVDMRQMDPLELEKNPQKKEELRSKTVQAVHQLLEEEAKEVQDRKERAALAKETIDEALGLGAIEPLLENPEVTEIMVNGPNQIFVEQKGKITLSDYCFTSEKHLLGCIERIVSPIGRRVDEKTPLCDARLPDGSRINVVIPPLSLTGPVLTIRKFFKEKLEVSDLVKFGTLTDEMADFLRAAVEAKLNVVVSGGTGTGKTTLLNLISSFIPTDERIVTVEDSAELQLPQDHVITLESRPANIQGEGAIHIRDLVKNSLRMRPDRIVVGECRSGEALDMLQAMNTGHDGSLTTIHANNPRDCLRRLETLVMMAGFDLPIQAIREQIASAIHLIVQLRRYGDGSRKIANITEVMGMEGETMVTQPIFEFKQSGMDDKGKVRGSFQASGLIPKFVETLKAKGISLPRGLFGGGTGGGGSKPSSSEGTSGSSAPQKPATPQKPGVSKPGTQSGAPPTKKPTQSGKIPVKNPHGVKKR